MDNSDTGNDNDNVLEKLMTLIIGMPNEQRLNLLNQLETANLREDTDAKRSENRKLYLKELVFDFENYIYTGTIIDISTSGAFIETSESFKIGQMIMVNIPDTRDEGHVRLAGEIVRVEPEGIGVKFISKSNG